MLILVDTGPLIAYLDRSDPEHAFVRQRWDMPGRFVTTGPVLTEAMHFLGPLRAGPKRLLEFLRAANLQVLDVFSTGMLNRAAALMEQYADIPMDFADATLVAAAEKFQIAAIITLDERGFRVFRYSRGKRFRLLLQDG